MALDLNNLREKLAKKLNEETKESLLDWYFKERYEEVWDHLGEGEFDVLLSTRSKLPYTSNQGSSEPKSAVAGEYNYAIAA
jgi:hypothetical protein